ncbi:ScbA/BarX family gamma-butyrolactone biosynthesis protein [Streptomyces thermoviolaceus]|uniref:ScbA/BarX family gamma-butyrolactone biosynthesis protein n=1 Tax=Streptomyces thermoviolaceus TaxID=1952 RepID=UPI001F1035A1|nr:ScbA/BarX family gamma-butyrolactone biosynthesis protein [Streptomyces thermoviolaceus]
MAKKYPSAINLPEGIFLAVDASLRARTLAGAVGPKRRAGGGNVHVGSSLTKILPGSAESCRTGRRAASGSPVPRASVHKASGDEVLLSAVDRVGDDRFRVTPLWRRDHYLGHLGGGVCDPVLLAETVRQAAIHVSHRFYGVPYGHPFVMHELTVDLGAPLPGLSAELPPVAVEAQVRRREGRKVDMCMQSVVEMAGRRLGRARVRWAVLDPDRYARLRNRTSTAVGAETVHGDAVPLVPSRVGHRLDRDVLLAAAPAHPGQWWLRLDPGHPVLFDHPSDHIPGMALVEAFRQMSTVLAHGTPAAHGSVPRHPSLLSVAFTSFGELDAPVLLTAQPADGEDDTPGTVLLRALQDGRELAHARVRHPALGDTGRDGKEATC